MSKQAGEKQVLNRTESQLIAADPARHVWVAASAGTGKTHVLTDRMLRLLLAGSPPDRILALTFTKAAAAEMQNRLTKRLGQWQTLDDADLNAELAVLGLTPTDALRRRARTLFAHALDVPGGLRVQTLHSFAQGLLAAFPVEAGLQPGFRALEERDATQLRRQALNEVIAQAQSAGDQRYLDDLAQLSILKGEGGVMRILDRMIAHSEGVAAFTSEDGFEPAIRRWLGVGATERPGERLAEALDPAVHDDARLAELAEGMEAWGTATGQKDAAAARTWLAGDTATRVATFSDLWKLVLTQEGEPKKHQHAVKKTPSLRGTIDDIAADLLLLADLDKRIAAAELAARTLRAGHRVVQRYARLKRAQVAIDFDDMIAETARLLGPDGIPSYVAWKLDSRFDHVLVDEAQDTNQRQWAIIGRIIEDFFDPFAERESGRRRSLFVVGDYKQAIYGFQGTDPKVFQAEAARISPAAATSGRPLQPVDLDLSFRSGPAVLDLVNAFLESATASALGLPAAPPPHQPYRATAPGEVVLWPVLTPEGEEGDDIEDNSEAADRLMAKHLAAEIAGWLDRSSPNRLWLPAKSRWAEPQDILVLLRKRSWLMAALVGRLHEAGVPVAGVDRLLLTEPLAVLDCLALVRFAVQPEDDLTLATLLVSPFLGWDHEQLRRLSNGKPGIWAKLGASSDPQAQQARAFLSAVLALADFGGPYAFLDTILSGPLSGRRRLVARLGPEANDPLDELLLQALAFEARHPPALAAFLAWIEAEGSDVKRDSEAPRGQVRLMTIHGSKGLEAPVVVLADSAHKRREDRSGHVPVSLDGAPKVPLFHPSAKENPQKIKDLLAEIDAREAQEDLRLLYVGLTRAADHLYIGGAVGAAAYKHLGTEKDTSWHNRIRPAMEALEPERIVLFGKEALRIRRGEWTVPVPETTTVEAESTQHEIHEILITPAPPIERPSRPLTPSAMPDEPPEGPAAAAMRAAAQRGSLVHKLFERLPQVPPAERRARAIAWLTAQGAAHPDRIADEVLAVLGDPAYAALFGPSSLAEAPVAALVNDQAILGTVDRLLVEETRVLIVDFKTGLRIPASPQEIPLPHRRQMAAYTAVLQRAFPGRSVEAALLYTAGPKFLLLPPKLMEGLLPLE
ncbi:double-strand break repair helicase AddA [Sandaracinobacteroides hominis]|uniref:double-strand break repair helicase AddA n=1 Tax=Sandaracinobacteroides hominis TaxID=2780086 RepID=UPI0018F5EAAD|nr:double-strand break repair helicase AddA [Sandaracinobacteroides hominis]